MRSALKWILFVAIMLVALSALYLSLPVLKEGWPTQSPLYVYLVAAILGVLIYLWRRVWLVAGQPAQQPVYYLGIVVAAVPLLLYVWVGGMMAYHHLRAGVFESRVAISHYHATEVYWPGFTQPIGVRLELGIDAPFSIPGSLLAPRIVLTDSLREGKVTIGEYFRYCSLPGDPNACLTVPPSPYRPPPTIRGNGTNHVVYELFPANIAHLEDPDRLCLQLPAPESSQDHGQLHAIWLYGSAGGSVIDLSTRLTESLQRDSVVVWAPEKLRAMSAMFREDVLLRAGYQSCVLGGRTSSCYCRGKK